MGSGLKIGDHDSGAEREADQSAARVLKGQPSNALAALPGALLQRDPPAGGAGSGAPIDSDRGVTVTPHIDLNLIDLSLGVLRGEHQVTITPGLSDPLNIFGTPIPGMSPSQLSLMLGYENRCNRSFQRALVGMRQTQPAGRLTLDFARNPNEIEAGIGFRSGRVLIEPGGTVGFTGSSLDSVLFTLSITSVSAETPPECIAPPAAPTHQPDQPTPTPDRGTPGTTVDTPTRDPDVPPPRETTLPSYTLYFFYDATMLRPESNSTYRQILSLLQTVPSLHVILTGHASLEGTDDYNMALSERRAEAMRLRLSIEGIAASRIHTLHYGESAPAVPEPEVNQRTLLPSVERIRNLNRRVPHPEGHRPSAHQAA